MRLIFQLQLQLFLIIRLCQLERKLCGGLGFKYFLILVKYCYALSPFKKVPFNYRLFMRQFYVLLFIWLHLIMLGGFKSEIKL